MADYTQPDVVQKRVRFFDGQFLQDQDFVDEQKYHLDRERRQSRLLRISGIGAGLTVKDAGERRVAVTGGSAVDALGRHIVLGDERVLSLRGAPEDTTVTLHLVYAETATDMKQTAGQGARRWDETPRIVAVGGDGNAVAVSPDSADPRWEGPSIPIADVVVRASGQIEVDQRAVARLGVTVPGAVTVGFPEATRVEGRPDGLHVVDAAKGGPADLTVRTLTARTVTSAGTLTVSGGLTVTGRLLSAGGDGGLTLDGDRFLGAHEADGVGVFNNGWRLTVRPDGRVGVGTDRPAARLTVQDDSAATTEGRQLVVRGETDQRNEVAIGYHTGRHYGSVQAVTQGIVVRPLLLNPLGGWVGINVQGQPRATLEVNGSIISPMWRVAHLMNQWSGPLSREAAFATAGGTALLLVTGTMTVRTPDLVGVRVMIDGGRVQDITFRGSNTGQRIPVAGWAVVPGMPAGDHRVRLDAYSGSTMSTDGNDIFDVMLMELPF